MSGHLRRKNQEEAEERKSCALPRKRVPGTRNESTTVDALYELGGLRVGQKCETCGKFHRPARG